MSTTDSTDGQLSLLSGLAAFSLCVMFGSNAIAVKMSFAGLGVYFASVVRFSIASVCLILWARFTKQPLLVRKEDWLSLGIIAFSFSSQLLLFYTGLSMTAASRSAIIINLQPFFVLVLAHFFIVNDRMTIKKFVGISFGFTGIVLIFIDESALSGSFRSGDMFVLGGAFLWACNAVYTKKVIHRYQAIQIALYPMLVSIPISALGSCFFDKELIQYWDTTILLSLAYQSLIVATFGYVAWNSLFKRYGAVSLHSFIFIMPVTGVVLGGLLLNEPITIQLIFGLAFIVTGLLVIHLKRKVEPPATPVGRIV